MNAQRDPHGLPASAPGAKLDADKLQAGLLLDFSHALEAVAAVATFGAKKYSPGGWLKVPDGQRRYTDALMRHLLTDAHGGGNTHDEESGLLHAAHAAWNALATLELALRRGTASMRREVQLPPTAAGLSSVHSNGIGTDEE